MTALLFLALALLPLAQASIFFATGANNLTGLAVVSRCLNASGTFSAGESLWTERSQTDPDLFDQRIEYFHAGAVAEFNLTTGSATLSVRETGGTALMVNSSVSGNITTEIIDSAEKRERVLLSANGTAIETDVLDVRVVTKRVFNDSLLVSSTIIGATPNVSTITCH
jgi:hypothetical protein